MQNINNDWYQTHIWQGIYFWFYKTPMSLIRCRTLKIAFLFWVRSAECRLKKVGSISSSYFEINFWFIKCNRTSIFFSTYQTLREDITRQNKIEYHTELGDKNEFRNKKNRKIPLIPISSTDKMCNYMDIFVRPKTIFFYRLWFLKWHLRAKGNGFLKTSEKSETKIYFDTIFCWMY